MKATSEQVTIAKLIHTGTENPEAVKSALSKVRELVPKVSDEDALLALRDSDNDVETAVDKLLDGTLSLDEWHVQGQTRKTTKKSADQNSHADHHSHNPDHYDDNVDFNSASVNHVGGGAGRGRPYRGGGRDNGGGAQFGGAGTFKTDNGGQPPRFRSGRGGGGFNSRGGRPGREDGSQFGRTFEGRGEFNSDDHRRSRNRSGDGHNLRGGPAGRGRGGFRGGGRRDGGPPNGSMGGNDGMSSIGTWSNTAPNESNTWENSQWDDRKSQQQHGGPGRPNGRGPNWTGPPAEDQSMMWNNAMAANLPGAKHHQPGPPPPADLGSQTNAWPVQRKGPQNEDWQSEPADQEDWKGQKLVFTNSQVDGTVRPPQQQPGAGDPALQPQQPTANGGAPTGQQQQQAMGQQQMAAPQSMQPGGVPASAAASVTDVYHLEQLRNLQVSAAPGGHPSDEMLNGQGGPAQQPPKSGTWAQQATNQLKNELGIGMKPVASPEDPTRLLFGSMRDVVVPGVPGDRNLGLQFGSFDDAADPYMMDAHATNEPAAQLYQRSAQKEQNQVNRDDAMLSGQSVKPFGALGQSPMGGMRPAGTNGAGVPFSAGQGTGLPSTSATRSVESQQSFEVNASESASAVTSSIGGVPGATGHLSSASTGGGAPGAISLNVNVRTPVSSHANVTSSSMAQQPLLQQHQQTAHAAQGMGAGGVMPPGLAGSATGGGMATGLPPTAAPGQFAPFQTSVHPAAAQFYMVPSQYNQLRPEDMNLYQQQMMSLMNMDPSIMSNSGVGAFSSGDTVSKQQHQQTGGLSLASATQASSTLSVSSPLASTPLASTTGLGSGTGRFMQQQPPSIAVSGANMVTGAPPPGLTPTVSNAQAAYLQNMANIHPAAGYLYGQMPPGMMQPAAPPAMMPAFLQNGTANPANMYSMASTTGAAFPGQKGGYEEDFKSAGFSKHVSSASESKGYAGTQQHFGGSQGKALHQMFDAKAAAAAHTPPPYAAANYAGLPATGLFPSPAFAPQMLHSPAGMAGAALLSGTDGMNSGGRSGQGSKAGAPKGAPYNQAANSGTAYWPT